MKLKPNRHLTDVALYGVHRSSSVACKLTPSKQKLRAVGYYC